MTGFYVEDYWFQQDLNDPNYYILSESFDGRIAYVISHGTDVRGYEGYERSRHWFVSIFDCDCTQELNVDVSLFKTGKKGIVFEGPLPGMTTAAKCAIHFLQQEFLGTDIRSYGIVSYKPAVLRFKGT